MSPFPDQAWRKLQMSQRPPKAEGGVVRLGGLGRRNGTRWDVVCALGSFENERMKMNENSIS